MIAISSQLTIDQLINYLWERQRRKWKPFYRDMGYRPSHEVYGQKYIDIDYIEEKDTKGNVVGVSKIVMNVDDIVNTLSRDGVNVDAQNIRGKLHKSLIDDMVRDGLIR